MTKVKMIVPTWWTMPDPKTGIIKKTNLLKGKVYDVRPEVADRWISRGIAEAAADEPKEAKK